MATDIYKQLNNHQITVSFIVNSIVKQFIPSTSLCFVLYFANAQWLCNIISIMTVSLRSGPKYWDISYVMNGLDVLLFNVAFY